MQCAQPLSVQSRCRRVGQLDLPILVRLLDQQPHDDDGDGGDDGRDKHDDDDDLPHAQGCCALPHGYYEPIDATKHPNAFVP